MRIAIKLFGALALVVGAGCGPMELEVSVDLSAESQAAEEARKLTADELQALVDYAEKNPPIFQDIACPAANTCDASFAACTSWSPAINCGSPSNCKLFGCVQPQYQYQVCFNPFGEQCVSVARSSTTI
jgi:hypothetical protein